MYVGYDDAGQLTEAVRRRPFRVILFDEIEKAHPEVFGILLQILEDGHLTDGHGRTVDFRNTVVIMTSNLGTQDMGRPAMGFQRTDGAEGEWERLKASAEEGLKQTFRPELINRIDEIIVFHPLTQEQILQIVDLMVAEVQERLKEHDITIELTQAARESLAKKGFDPVYGARPLRRAIQRLLENPLAKDIVSGRVQESDRLLVEVEADALVFHSTQGVPAA